MLWTQNCQLLRHGVMSTIQQCSNILEKPSINLRFHSLLQLLFFHEIICLVHSFSLPCPSDSVPLKLPRRRHIPRRRRDALLGVNVERCDIAGLSLSHTNTRTQTSCLRSITAWGNAASGSSTRRTHTASRIRARADCRGEGRATTLHP